MARERDFVVHSAQAAMGVLRRIPERFKDKQLVAYAVSVPTRDNLHYAYQGWYPLGYQACAVAANATDSSARPC